MPGLENRGSSMVSSRLAEAAGRTGEEASPKAGCVDLDFDFDFSAILVSALPEQSSLEALNVDMVMVARVNISKRKAEGPITGR